jgi:hypothetical protein
MDPNAMVLRVTTLSPGDHVKGVVKKCDAAVVRVPAAGVTLEFPFP